MAVVTDSPTLQLRLMLEELCCDLCRFEHVKRENVKPEMVRIDREYPLGGTAGYADIRVMAPGHRPYFVEVKYGYDETTLLAHLKRK